jgi:hypothetical protein
MAKNRTVEFLPEIFQTSTNRQFLNATLDQLVQEPSVRRIQGYVGRRVGPGVNANDEYIKESTPERADYQLEPGVVFLEPDTSTIQDVITYPGITEALNLQGAITDRADRLYTSDYYTWDPFVDFDKLVNFSQYYWLPEGPDAVDVFSGAVPMTDNFVVTRENGVYTFSGIAGTNPVLTLVRGGNYTFEVAQNAKESVNFRVTNQPGVAFVIDFQNNPTLTLVRGNTYVFNLAQREPYQFYIKTQPTLGTTNIYSATLPDGNPAIVGNGSSEGLVTFVVPQSAPDTLYYANPIQPAMGGQINVVDAVPGTGPGFWIQTDPGVNGRIPSTPNISSRGVLGVSNNGEDLGTVIFDVPLSTAQSFFYTLNNVGGGTAPYAVNLITGLKFNQINNVFVDQFFAANPQGIDGITTLNGRTLVFLQQSSDPVDGGWLQSTQFDPLPTGQNGQIGSYDSTTYDQDTVVPVAQRYSVWQIVYVTAPGGSQYMTLVPVQEINNLEKFFINSGDVYSSTQWYKTSSGNLQQIPLLTAVRDTLWYQDGTDPEIFGRIRIVDQDSSDQLDIDDIIGKKNYISPNGVQFTNGLRVQFRGTVVPASYQNQEYYVEGVGTAIQLLPVGDFVTPERYTQSASLPFDSTGYDVGNFDASLNQPLIPDYLTINRASPDRNAWSRSNRWFHVDVINESARNNNIVPALDNAFRARRPILEYRSGLRLYDFGTQGKQPVNIIDFYSTDALSVVNGSLGYGTDGYNFVSGTRVIFAADLDPQVRNKIYTVTFIVPDSGADGSTIPQPVIHLVPAADADVLVNQSVVCLSGITQQGLSFYYDGVTWLPAQSKTQVNQPPLFNVYDAQNISLGDRVRYPGSNFRGSRLFSYAVSSGPADPVLGFALRYLSLTNVGDIVFDNNLYSDSFVFTKNSVSSTEPISQGSVRQYADRVVFDRLIGWQPAATKSLIRQQFQFRYDGQPLLLDVPVDQSQPVPAVLIYVGSKFQPVGSYRITITGNTTSIELLNIFAPGEVIEVDALSDQVSAAAFYNVPINLQNNPFNQNSSTFTLGTVRSHYQSIAENLLGLQGPVNGANNSRDLGNIIPYGLNILQQSSPLTLAGYFMRSAQYNIFSSIAYNSREYEKFKAQLLDNVVRNDYTNYAIPEMLTAVIQDITAGRTASNSFYWSDMLPASNIFTEISVTYTPISVPTFDLTQTYDFTSSNYQGLLVYVNGTILTQGLDYVVATDGPRLTIVSPLAVGDVIVIREYATTFGNFVPNTPTKMGLYPAYVPRMYLDTGYITPTMVIQGHDGSITVAFGDFRDQLLLEFETRIYNNLKIKSAIPLTAVDVIPGQFRDTDYSLAETTQILSQDFLSWIGWNKLNYQNQEFNANNEFTWNYSASGNRLSGSGSTITEQPLPAGAWRGIYLYFYDTVNPALTPWEMLGFSVQPAWWTDTYGPAPYTRDNLVLWQDLAAGRVMDPAGQYIRPKYARPGLTDAIPVNGQGQLLSPFDAVVGLYDSSQFRKSWSLGDLGPTEYAWRASSAYPFALMRLLALTRPAEFFSLFADRDLYRFDTDFDQYLLNGRYRLDANGVQVYGDGVSKASYLNWIVDYNQQLGMPTTQQLTRDLASLDVRLCYRTGGFTGKQYLKIYTEKSSPNSLNSGLLLPDESFSALLYKNQPFARTVYSSVILQVVEGGWAVFGYSITQPFFEILASRTSGPRTTLSAGGTTVQVPNTYFEDVVQIPYGYVFTNATVVADFLLSYGALLTSQGLVFNDRENGRALDWNQMAQEFLYWTNQGWGPGSVINLNPAAFSLTVVREQAIVDNIQVQTLENQLLDQNRTTLPVRDLVVDREGNSFTVSSLSQQTVSYLDLRYTSYETMLVLDNVSIFNDLIYDPVTGARQSRVNVMASISADWNGQLDAQGFVYNDPRTVRQWQPGVKYTKGDIVQYKNIYWSAQNIVQPAEEFEFSQWVKSDYTRIQQGLLQNIPNKANQLANSYNIHTANLNVDQDLLSYGLTGFRPREYMTALNLDDVSQVNVYQQFIQVKGTNQAVRIIGDAKLAKESAEYDVYENWAIQRGVYGANANRRFVELRLNRALLTSDPAVVQIIEPGQVSQADQPILLENVWRTSTPLTSPDIFPATVQVPTDTALPTAGYVNLNDVDITIFSLEDNLRLAPGVLDIIGIGTTIWAAKVNSYNWNVYRCNSVPGFLTEISSNLNGTSNFRFTKPHGLLFNSVIVVRFFSDTIDGVYRVVSVVDPQTVSVALNSTNTIRGQGVAFFLQSQRVAQASDVASLPFAQELTPGVRAWVDNIGDGRWAVLQKQTSFDSTSNLALRIPDSGGLFGTSVAQGTDNLLALIGSPTTGGAGAVHSYLRDDLGLYAENSTLTLNATDSVGYGSAVVIGNQQWCAATAPASLTDAGYATVIYRPENSSTFETRQLLTSPTGPVTSARFGSAVTVSADERWLYIGESGQQQVHAYGLTDIPEQSVRYTTVAGTTDYQYSDDIVIDSTFPDQLIVLYNNTALVEGIDQDYTVTADVVRLTAPRPAGQILTISRRSIAVLDTHTFRDLSADSTSGTGIDALFTVTNNRGGYTVALTESGTGYTVADTLTINGTALAVPGSLPNLPTMANDLVITVTEVDGLGGITAFTTSGTGVDNNTIFSLEQYLYTATDIWSFTVAVSGVLQRPAIDYTFDSALKEIEFLTVPGPGTSILISAASYFKYVTTISTPSMLSATQFGVALATTTDGRQLMIGAPGEDAVYAYDRSTVRYVVTDPSQTTYALPASFEEPVAVVLDNQYLTNSALTVNGQFSVVGTNVVLSNSVSPAVGDILELESNVFRLIQRLEADQQFDDSDYGAAVAVCGTNCSVYIGAPRDGSVLISAGSVERRVNQARLYGVITTMVANPVLASGDTILINQTPVAVPAAPLNTVAGLADAIVEANIPNVTAQTLPDVIFTGDGITQIFDVGTVYSDSEYTGSPNTVVMIDDVIQGSGFSWTNNFTTLNFVVAPVVGSTIRVVSGRLTISVVNVAASDEFSRLSVLPGITGTAFADLGIPLYAYTQTIASPNPSVNALFGTALSVDTSSTNLIVGAPKANLFISEQFDAGRTFFDDHSTRFSTTRLQSGVVYTFDYLPSANPSVTNPGKFVFGQQIYDAQVMPLIQWGTAVDYTGSRLLVGAPANNNTGRVAIFDNPTRRPVWTPVQIQQPAVDVHLLNSVFVFNPVVSSETTFFDFINPLQGKILGAARSNIDYVGSVDPARYNVGTVNNNGTTWAADRVGEIWWDTTQVRYIDPNQDSIVYASRRWSQLFPGSRVEVYQWIQSSVPPAEYTGPGVPLSVTKFAVNSRLSPQGVFNTEYYFWVQGIDTIDTSAGKTLSTVGIARYIADPRSSGIPYIAAINASTIAIYNGLEYISAQDTILHVEYDQQLTEDNIHVEYELIAAGRPDSFLNDNLYRKLQDSFSGVNTTGARVPDPTLSPPERFGVEFRPRQSMFADRLSALKNYLTYVNRVLLAYPVVETRKFTLLNSSEPTPPANVGLGTVTISIASPAVISFNNADINSVQLPKNTPVVFSTSGQLPTGITAGTIYYIASILSGNNFTVSSEPNGVAISTSGTQSGVQSLNQVAWNLRLANIQELSYQNLNTVSLGYKYLIQSDSTNNGLWTIYQVTAGVVPTAPRTTQLIRVQTYDTRKYWNTVNWYEPGYNVSVLPVAEVPNFSSLVTVQVSVGSVVKVTANAQNKFELYQRTPTGWNRVGLQDGTIQFSAELWDYELGRIGFDVEVFDAQYFDQEPVIETRKIIQAINQDLFVGELAIERNSALILVFNYILTEFEAPTWLTKTSLIDVEHRIRELEPFQIFRQDNQTFVLDYLQEVKPYHVQVREFNLAYNGFDQYSGSLTDFDNPAYYRTDLDFPQYVSPVLLPYTQSTAVGTGTPSPVANTPADAQIWLQSPWSEWFNNYLLTVLSVQVVKGGTGYTVAPLVEVSGDCVVPAEFVAEVNSAGQVINVIVINPGVGYSTTATLTLVGGNGTGAAVAAVMTNALVRSIRTTIKYDRYQYSSDIVTWQANVIYPAGTQVRFNDQVWAVPAGSTAGGAQFDPQQWTRIPAADLSGVDRTRGFYLPLVNEVGLNLPLLIDGIDYPGVQVSAPLFSQNTGFDVGNYDINVFDNIAFGPEGRPTYDPAILDAVYESSYLDPFLGTRPTDINVDGGAYIDTYSSHAPQELVPGSEFDTLDMRVYTRPGSDWLFDGHGFLVQMVNAVVVDNTTAISFDGQMPYPVQVSVINQTSNQFLDPGIDYSVNWVNKTVTVNASTTGDVVQIAVYGLGGSNQLYRSSYVGNTVNDGVVVPVATDEIQQLAVFVNGTATAGYTLTDIGLGRTRIEFDATYTDQQWISVTVLGTTVTPAGPVNYSWSTPQTQVIVAPASTLTYTLINSVAYSNPADFTATVGGRRARTPAARRHTGTGIETVFACAERLGIDQSLIADSEIQVYVDSVQLVLNSGYVVNPYTSGARTVTLTAAPSLGSRVLVAVTTNAQCTISGSQLIFNPAGGLVPVEGEIISVTTWNDTRQQDIVNQVIVGPVPKNIVLQEPYDSTNYDSGTVTGDPGSFDYAAGAVIFANDLFLAYPVTDPSRLQVSFNGYPLVFGSGFTVEGLEVILTQGVITNADVVQITQFTNSVVPDAMAFRIFQDMRGVQAVYRITDATTTYLTQPLTKTDDVIHVANASALTQPNVAVNRWGVLTVNGERIMYRNRNTVLNTVSSLRRGTAGTGIPDVHPVDALVYDMGRTNLLPAEYQDRIVSASVIANGTTVIFDAPNIDLATYADPNIDQAVQVYVGGILQITGYTVLSVSPVNVELVVAPPEGVEVTILVKQGVTWYEPDPIPAGFDKDGQAYDQYPFNFTSPSNGQALQDTNTPAARFLRGL